MKKIAAIQFLSAALFLAGCSSMDNIPVDAACSSMDNIPVNETIAEIMPARQRNMAKSADKVSNAAFADGNFTAPQGRKMAFTANITVNVANVKKAVADARKIANESGGYVKSMNNNMLTLAIPVAKGDEILNVFAKMGEVSNLRIEGSDVTEQVEDLKIRMENLEKSRKRLLAMMDRTANVRDLTQVERELSRVTTELERLQAADKNLTNRIAYITVTVRFETYVPAHVTPTANVPILWINQLGEGLQHWITAGENNTYRVPFRVTLPAKFFFAGGEYAVSGNNCNIRFRELPNAITEYRWYGKKYADTNFYKDMIMKALKTRFGKDVSCTESKIDKKDALLFKVEANLHGTDYLYLVAVAVDDDTVKIIEAKGKKQEFLKDLAKDNWKKMLDSIRF